MRLLVLTQYFWPENFRVNDLVSALQSRGHEVTVLTGQPNYPGGDVFDEYERAPAQFMDYHGARVVRVPLLPRRRGAVRLAMNYASFAMTASTIGLWKLRGQRFDVVFVYQPSPITSALPALAIGRFKGAPVVLWTLDLWPETLRAVGAVRSPRALAIVGRMVSFIYRRCALVLGQSRGFRESVAQYAGSDRRFRYFPQWSETLFPEHDASAAAAPEVEPFADSFNVLFAGNIGDAQDFPAVLDAADRLKHERGIRWLIVGDGRAADWVRNEIERRELTAHVFLLGRHAIERMPAFFRGADALLVSLKRDPVFSLTIPGKVQTYLAAGLPLLGMLDGEGARVITESGAGLACAAGDSESLARNVQQLAALSAQQRAEMGDRGRRYASREFDRDRLLEQLEAWFEECLGEPSRALAVEAV